MYFVILFLAFAFILLLISQYGRSKYKKLVTITICMIMIGVVCWGYNELYFFASYKITMNKGAFDALINQNYIFVIGMILLALSIPCTLFCLLSKPMEKDIVDYPLEEPVD